MNDLAVTYLSAHFLHAPEICARANPYDSDLVTVRICTSPVWPDSPTRRVEIELTMRRADLERLGDECVRVAREARDREAISVAA